MKRRIILVFNLFILLLLTGLNLFIYQHRNEDFAYKEFLSYPQLYELKEDLRVTGLINKGTDSLVVKLSPEYKNALWEISDSSHLRYNCAGQPIIKLKAGKITYEIKRIPSQTIPSIKLGINYTAKEIYQKNKRNRESVSEFFSSSIPVGNYKTYALSEWQQDSPYTLEDEKELVKTLLSSNTTIKEEDSSLDKLKKTAAFLLKKLDTCRGIPGDIMDSISPYQRYEAALKGDSKVWCGDFSAIFAFFMETQGITCREVCLEGELNDIVLAGHSFNEAYIPDLHKWVFVDLTSKAILVSLNTNYLNTLDLYELHKNKIEGIKIVSWKNDSLVQKEYESIKPFYDYYFSIRPEFIYYFNSQYRPGLYGFTSKIKRYFSKHATFGIYQGNQVLSNEKFYFKQVAAFALVTFIIYLAVLYFLLNSFKKQADS